MIDVFPYLEWNKFLNKREKRNFILAAMVFRNWGKKPCLVVLVRRSLDSIVLVVLTLEVLLVALFVTLVAKLLSLAVKCMAAVVEVLWRRSLLRQVSKR